MIPHLIHQIWLGESGGSSPPSTFQQAAASWRHHHHDWEYRLWGSAEIRQLFAAARPELQGLYDAYPYWVQRADAARYLILHRYGGIYADLDILCERSFEFIGNCDLVLAPTKPLGVSNDLMATEAGHPLFRRLLDELPSSYHRWQKPWVLPHFQIMCGTGSLHLSRVFAMVEDHTPVRLLSNSEYGHGNIDEALVRHIDGNTWAGWDTHALIFLQKRWKRILLGVLIILVLLAFLL